MGFSSYDDIINAITVDEDTNELAFSYSMTSPEAAGVWHSLMRTAIFPGSIADPSGTPGDAHDNLASSIFWGDVESGGVTRHLLSLGAVTTVNCTLCLYDRLVGVSGIGASSTANKTVASAARPLYPTGDGV